MTFLTYPRLFSVLLGASLLLSGCTGGESTPTAASAERALPQEPVKFALIERSGKKMTEADLSGKVWVASFIFTHCPGPCLLISQRMKELSGELADEADVRLVSITVDPKRDEPAVLAKYATQYGADPERWLFFTGDAGDIERLQDGPLGGSGVASDSNTSAQSGKEQGPNHMEQVVVVGRDGRARGYYKALSALDRPAILSAVRRVLAEK